MSQKMKRAAPRNRLRRVLLSCILTEESVADTLRRRQQLSGEREDKEARVKRGCFLTSSLVFTPLLCALFLFKRNSWFTNSYGTLDWTWTLGLGILAGLLMGLFIGVGLFANLLISYAHLIESRLNKLRDARERPEKDLDKEEWEAAWKEYELHIELYKYYLDMGLKANLFFYFITGGILGIYLQNPARRMMKFSLLLPVLVSLAFGGVFIHGAFLWMRISDVIKEIRRELKLKRAPDINLMSLLLIVFGTIFLIIGFSIVLLAIFT